MGLIESTRPDQTSPPPPPTPPKKFAIHNESGPRGAVGGCSTPGSRVDPWWNPGPLFPSATTPGPPRIDEGPPGTHSSISNTTNNPYLSSPSPYHSTTTTTSTAATNSNNNNNDHQQTNRNLTSPYSVASATSPSTSSPTFGQVDSLSRCSDAVGTNPNNSNLSENVLSNLLAPKSSDSSHLGPQGVEHTVQSNGTVLATLLSTTSSSLEYTPSPNSTTGSSAIRNPQASNIAVAVSSPSSSTSSRDSLTGILSSLNVKIKSEDQSRREESSGFCTSLLSSLLSTSRISTTRNLEESADQQIEEASIKVEYSLSATSPCSNVLEASEEDLVATSPYDIISTSARCIKQSAGGCRSQVSPTSEIAIEMKYETQTGPPPGPPHLTSTGVEPPHSSQGSGMVIGASPGEVVGVDSLLLPWGTTGSDFLEPPDVKQTAGGLQDAWDTLLLGSSVGVASAQSLAELKPLPPFTGYTGHLSINGIPGHHYHTIASSAQRPTMQSSSSPTPSSNQEYYESSVVSSSTPCPQASQKHQHHHQQQQQQQQQQHQPQQHHHQPQQLPQSTQQVDYDIEDIAEIIGSAIADTTVPGSNNGPGSEHDPDASRDWIDIAEWINTACSPKGHETSSPSPYPQMYTSTNPASQTHPHGSTLQSLLTTGYAPLLQARLQAGNTNMQNTSCGETPSSTSPYPPVSPPGRVSTSCSPDHLLHSSFPAPSHARKRSRPNPSNQNPSKKSPATSALAYGTESGLIGGKEKPVHRCSICNRGFLNKSNIKVHLRTHTGEKPFRCEVCGKAFRQKAHLIKHQQIHKRIGRD
ncbi:mucin-5AC [Diachasma alloeum]|uniref:mucin-5AC n=1 Tax=Diachasma alloeum TaxID=454923 RepID=UPI0007384D87|nr:mucin-5AC [Diachasma alloeum]